MDEDSLRSAILSLLQRVAPEVGPGAIDTQAPLRDQVDLDSMDFLNFLISINGELHVDVPETVYEQLRTLDDIVAYVRSHQAPEQRP